MPVLKNQVSLFYKDIFHPQRPITLLLSKAPLWESTINQPRVLLSRRRDKSSEHSEIASWFKNILGKASLQQAEMARRQSTVIEWKSAPDFIYIRYQISSHEQYLTTLRGLASLKHNNVNNIALRIA